MQLGEPRTGSATHRVVVLIGGSPPMGHFRSTLMVGLVSGLQSAVLVTLA
jgi:hypothetical protein